MTKIDDGAPAVSPVSQINRLLLVERTGSVPGLRELIGAIDSGDFCVAHHFPTIGEASEALESQDADLVLVEIGENAELDIAELSSHPVLESYLPFIALDASARDEVAQLAHEAGALEYLVKNRLTPRQLERTMRSCLKRAREIRKLRDDSRLFQALLAHVPDRIYFKDGESRFLRVSASVAQAHGVVDPATLIGKSDFLFYPSEQAEETYADERQVIESGEGIVGKTTWRQMPDGSQAWVSSTKLPLRDHRGRSIGTFGITRDLTEIKLLELELAAERDHLREANDELSGALESLRRSHEQLRDVQLQLIEAEKLKSIGRLAAGVAHEVKNPLAVISMGVEFLSGKYGADETTASVLKELAEAVGRADGVIKGLLDFSAPHQLDLQPYDLNVIIRASLRLVRGEIRREAHKVELDLAELPPVLLDRSKVCQVFLNLFTNALQAMAEGGTLCVRTRLEQVTEGTGCEFFKPGDEVVIAEVADTGPGIPPHLVDRVFEPFFTTKPSGKGTGLGMSVVKSIMHLQRGMVQMRNRETGGAAATLTFNAQKIS